METDTVTLTIGFKEGVFRAKVERTGYIGVDPTKILRTAIKEAVNFSTDFLPTPPPKLALKNTDSVSVTTSFDNGLFQAKVEKSGNIKVNVERILRTAVKEAVNFEPDNDVEQEMPSSPPELPSSDDEDEDEEVLTPPIRRVIGRRKSGCREAKRCFVNGQKIRHKCRGGDGWWTGVFEDGGIAYRDHFYTADDCLSQFARAHYYSLGLNSSYPPPLYSYWNECECLIDGQWVSTYDLPALY
jgi:hypothetical protein